MPPITVRGIPGELSDDLERAAEASRRGLGAEVPARPVVRGRVRRSPRAVIPGTFVERA